MAPARVSPIHRAPDRVDSWTGLGVAQVEGQVEIGLTDTLRMLEKRNIKIWLFGFLER